MAKKKRVKKKTVKKKGVNKSQAIRDYVEKNPSARNVDVVEGLAKDGVKVAPAQVSAVRARAESKRKGPKRKQKAKRNAATSAANKRSAAVQTNGDQVSLSSLLKARSFAAEVGGVEAAIDLLKAVKKLSD